MASSEIVITGMGLISPLGLDVAENWDNLRARCTGIGHYPRDTRPEFAQYLGQVTGFAAPAGLPGKLASQIRFLTRGSLLGLGAAREAVAQAAMDMSSVPSGRRALYLAAGDLTQVGYPFIYPAIVEGTAGRFEEMDYEKLNRATLDRVNPFFLLESINNNLFSFLSAVLGFMGTNTSLASLSPCGAQALELAARSIQQEHADIAVAVGCGNWISDVPLLELDGLGLLSACRHGAASFRPLDRKRDGFIPGEGGAALFLETSDSARRRGAPVLATIRGFGNATAGDVEGSWSVPKKVSEQSIRTALGEASCDLEDLAFLCPHGSGTPKGDRSELRSVTAVAEGKIPTVPICALKAYTSHLGAASDIAEVILGIQCLANQLAPATLNFWEADSEFASLNISGKHQSTERRRFLSTSYGILGQSSTVVVEVP
jgi:3-oxoacyl-[acyl-carrier-protein] synthase II